MAKAKDTKATEGSKASPVTRKQFTDAAKPLMATIDGKDVIVPVKLFESGSLGWYLSEKVVLKIGDTPVRVQLAVSMQIVNSKEAK